MLRVTINDVLQSNQELDIISISTLSLPSGSANMKYDYPDWAKLKQSFSAVVDNSVARMAQAIAISYDRAPVTKDMPPNPGGSHVRTCYSRPDAAQKVT